MLGGVINTARPMIFDVGMEPFEPSIQLSCSETTGLDGNSIDSLLRGSPSPRMASLLWHSEPSKVRNSLIRPCSRCGSSACVKRS